VELLTDVVAPGQPTPYNPEEGTPTYKSPAGISVEDLHKNLLPGKHPSDKGQ